VIGAYIKMTLGAAILIFLIATLTLWLLAQYSHIRPPLGLKEGRLLPCPNSPNCISSQANPHDKVHYLPPIEFTGSTEQAKNALLEVLHSQTHSSVVENDGNYIRSEFRSQIFGFVDDVEFLIDPETKVIHFRSASRVGHSDLGANRMRMEKLRSMFLQKLNLPAPDTSSGSSP